MKKALLYQRMVILLLLVAASVMRLNAEVVEIDGIYYELAGEEAVVTNNGQADCYSGTVVIPPLVTYGDMAYPVTAIGHSAFRNCTGLIGVDLPGSIITIGPRVFEGCTNLTSMIIPNSVTTMGANVFDKCYAIDSIVIGNKVTSLGDYMFNDCRELKSVIIGNSVTSIGKYAFKGCSSLSDVVIPSSVTTIGDWAFYDCSHLLSVTIGRGITHIGQTIFYHSNQITSVTCMATTPPSVVYGLFDDSGMYYHAKLHVLPESVTAYESAAIWKYFFQILGDVVMPIPGDVNGDGEITIADANNVVVIIVNGGNGDHTRVPTVDGVIDLADANSDGEINVADVNSILDSILNK